MKNRGRVLVWGLAYRLTLRAGALSVLAGAAAIGAALAAGGALGTTGPAGPPAAALAVATLVFMAGGSASDLRSGRGALYLGAARRARRWLLCDAALRFTGVGVLAAVMVAAGMAGAAAGGGPDGAAIVLRALPFLLISAWTLAALAHVFGNLSADLDALWTVLWAFPVSVIAVGLALADGSGWAWWLWLCFPVDGLAALAPANVGNGSLLPGPDARLRVFVFASAGWGVGTVAGLMRTRPGRPPPVRPAPRHPRADSPPVLR